MTNSEWTDPEKLEIITDLISWFYTYQQQTGIVPDTVIAPYGHYLDMVACIALSEFPTIHVMPHHDDFTGRRLYKQRQRQDNE